MNIEHLKSDAQSELEMNRRRWNRRCPRRNERLKDDDLEPDPDTDEYKVRRIRLTKKKRRHQGFTIQPAHRLWIFEK